MKQVAQRSDIKTDFLLYIGNIDQIPIRLVV